MNNLQKIFTTLGITRENGLFITSERDWSVDCKFPSRVQHLIANKIKPDAFFCFDNKPLILFYDSPKDIKAIHKAVWNFNESPIVIIAEADKIEVFNGFKYDNNHDRLQLIGDSRKLTDFSYFELVTGKSWEAYQKELSYSNRVDYHLLSNIKAARDILITQLNLQKEIANALIGKVIFVRYLIDRRVKIGFNGKARLWTNDDFCKLLKHKGNSDQFFKHLEDKFNGDMFSLKESEYQQITQNCLQVLIDLLSEVELSSGQQSLFKLYDFSIIPIEFVSNVYESFIGELNQEKEGAYYTPLFLVDYILQETVENRYSKDKTAYNCKVLDPACGSGIFLVETLRKIIERYLELNPNAQDNTKEFKATLQQLAKDNIYGVDRNLSAIQVAIFSIQLTLLDYQNPSSIENFRFPKLLNTNFFEADFFDLEHDFNVIFQEFEFDFILGNPPWKRGKGEKKPLFVDYIAKRRKCESELNEVTSNQVTISNNEIAQAFLLRISDFNLIHNCAFIVTSKVLYNLNAKSFRKYFLDNYEINKVFELAPVRHEVFHKSNDPAVTPAVILFYNYANRESTDKSIIEHIALKPSRFFSLFNIFSINRNDCQKVEQKKLKLYDWLWKTLVYGSFLDFNLIRRLKENYTPIRDIISNKKQFLIGQGVMVGGGDQNDSSHLIGLPYIDTRRDIKPFWVKNTNETWELSKVHRPRAKALYEAPMLLMTGGATSQFRSVAAVCNCDTVYKSSLTAIKAYNKNDINVLRVISALLNSPFFSYYALSLFSSIGIEREEVHDKEKWSVPYHYSESVNKVVEDIEGMKKELYSYIDIEVLHKLERYISDKIKVLDGLIEELFNFSELESVLLDFANNFTIPLIKKAKGYESILKSIPINDNYIEEYAKLYLNRFQPNLNNQDQKFVVEVWHSNHLLGMFFKVVPNAEYSRDIVWLDKKDDEILPFIIKLSSQQITDKLFVQKDIRGFEKDYFYIFKPNEKRLWHKAIGYLDVNEFMDAILKAGGKGE